MDGARFSPLLFTFDGDCFLSLAYNGGPFIIFALAQFAQYAGVLHFFTENAEGLYEGALVITLYSYFQSRTYGPYVKFWFLTVIIVPVSWFVH